MAIAINGSSNTITGIAVGGLPNGIVDNDMIANSTIAEAKLAANVNTITMVDQWRLSSNLTVGTLSLTTISANWERVDSVGQGTLNGGMTHSSGVWTFPETGIYKVEFNMLASSTANTNYMDVQLRFNNAGATPDTLISRILQRNDASHYCSGHLSTLLDIDNTSDCSLRFQSQSAVATGTITGNSLYNYCYATFTRLGDT